MTNVWPAGLPQYVNQDAFSEQPLDNVIRTSFDQASVKTRRRYTSVPRKFSFALILNTEMKAIMDGFHGETCKDGSLPFEWVLPAEQTLAVFLFMSTPKFSAVGPATFTCSFEVQTVP